MSLTLTIRDATTTGQPLHSFNLELPSERITVRELIRSRVYQEVKDHNVRAVQSPYRGLVQPSQDESTLNGPRTGGVRRQIDWKRQLDIALEAFKRNQVLVLVDDHQVGDLDEELELRSDTDVAFMKLVPLVGG